MAFNGKAIYQPKGRAGEYSAWACNFYTGCSNNCQYCYCKRGVMSHVWDTKLHLKKCFRNEEHALRTFVDEAAKNLVELQTHGIFFSFTTDPMLPETIGLTQAAVAACISLGIPVQILTKRADWDLVVTYPEPEKAKELLAFGFTLTGCDDLEPYASPNIDRVKKMIQLHKEGYKVFASIEPIIKIDASYPMINALSGWCDLLKVGLLSGRKEYDKDGVQFLYDMMKDDTRGSKFYLKESFVDFLGLNRATMSPHFVDSTYNIFRGE